MNTSNHLAQLTAESYQIHLQWIEQARELAEIAQKQGEVPVGAIVVDALGNAIAKAYNTKETDQDPTAHAELRAIQAACQTRKSWHLGGCTLYVTLEPCPMCAGVIIHSRIGLLVYGADDPKSGAIQTVLNLPDSAASNHKLAVLGGVAEAECREQLQMWFRARRNQT